MAVVTRNKRRDPLFESHTEEVLRKRGLELVGISSIVLSFILAVMLFTYHSEDPNWVNATSAPAHNAFGMLGASISASFMFSLGWASFLFPLTLLVWGLRLILHRGEERLVTRIVTFPLAVVAVSGFMATHVPPASWAQNFGLGGIFGDSILRGVIEFLPFGSHFSLKLSSLLFGFLSLFLVGFALGINWVEARSFWNVLRNGAVLLYATLFGIIGSILMQLFALLASFKSAKPYKGGGKKARIVVADNSTVPEFMQGDFASTDDRISARISDAIRKTKTVGDVQNIAPKLGGAARDLDGSPNYSPDVNTDVPTVLPRLSNAHSEPLVKPNNAKPATKSMQAKAEEQPKLKFNGEEDGYVKPPLSLLQNPTSIARQSLSSEALQENARMLENVLDDYGVKGEIVSVRPGPVVTMYELEPAAGLKASRVVGLADDIARSMSALSARVSTVPGRTVIGIELPNDNREIVLLREILSAKGFGDSKLSLPLALGKDIGGEAIVTSLAKMPHLLIAGTTGSGKSVAINTMILSLLYSLTPEECRLIMIDPKMLELSVYDGIPHLLSPVVTDPKKAVIALKWVVGEMEDRYRKMSKMGVRNIDGYNARVKESLAKGKDFTRTVQTGFDEQTGEPMFETESFTPEKIPYIVVVVDEMADLMMVAGKEIEACIQRLAQMARASGIHLIMATQRPSVDVITGTIKANFPTRISFQVTSKVDSRTILGEMGAEQLLGMGDMLYMEGGGRISRIHGPFVSDEEVEEVVNHLKAYGSPEYVSGVLDGPNDETGSDIDMVLGLGGNTNGEDVMYDQAVAIVLQDRKCSTSYIQRKLSIGYNKAANLVEKMEENGVVSAANHVGKRDILVPER